MTASPPASHAPRAARRRRTRELRLDHPRPAAVILQRARHGPSLGEVGGTSPRRGSVLPYSTAQLLAQGKHSRVHLSPTVTLGVNHPPL
jgi:hypothetical protein